MKIYKPYTTYKVILVEEEENKHLLDQRGSVEAIKNGNSEGKKNLTLFHLETFN